MCLCGCVCVCVEYSHNLVAERCRAQRFYLYICTRDICIHINTCFGAWQGLFDACQKLARKPFEPHSPAYSHIHTFTWPFTGPLNDGQQQLEVPARPRFLATSSALSSQSAHLLHEPIPKHTRTHTYMYTHTYTHLLTCLWNYGA